MKDLRGLPIEQVAAELGTDSRHGLTAEAAVRRLAADGPNVIPTERKISAIWKFFKQFHGILTYILLAVALISFALDHANDAYAILLVVFINVVVGFVQERRAEQAIAKLQKMIVLEATVIRDGREMRVAVADVVVGDLIILHEGDRVPADARLVTVREVAMDEAMLTGESIPVVKQSEAVSAAATIGDRADTVWMATTIVRGEAAALVVATGARTVFGGIAHSLASIRRQKTPLEARLDRLGKQLGIGAMVLAAVIFLFGSLQGNSLFDSFFFAVALVVSVVPEGLLTVLAVALAIGVVRMAKKNAIVRHLPAVETMGSVEVICTDKTGTLTENKMTVRSIVTADKDIVVTGEGWQPRGEFNVGGHALTPADLPELDRLLIASALTSTAELRLEGEVDGIVGDPTEGALAVLAAKGGRRRRELEENYRLIDEIPFSSVRKYRARLYEFTDLDGSRKRRVFVVGAHDAIWPGVTNVLAAGKERPFDEHERLRFEQGNEAMSGRAMRVLAVASKTVSHTKERLDQDDLHGLTLLGLIGMTDPPRPGVGQAIAKCRQAGIRVIMLTGDQKATALAIAREIGFRSIDEKNGVWTDADVAVMDDAAFAHAVESASIFARVSPETKLRIVRHLIGQGLTVAMTGDGVNDAPSLKQSSVGIAMGVAGTDVAREVSDIVLADDNFVSIVAAVEEGRLVFRNVRQTTGFLFMTNMGEAVTVLAALAVSPILPLLPVQILWMNLVTDGVNGVALAAERQNDDDVLSDRPRGRHVSIITKNLLLLSVITSVVMGSGTLWLFLWAQERGGVDYARTIAFTAMVMFQLWNVLSMRSATRSVFALGFWTNPYVYGTVALSFLFQVMTIYSPFLSGLLQVTPLTVLDWLLVVAATSPIFAVVELYKLAVRKGVVPASWI